MNETTPEQIRQRALLAESVTLPAWQVIALANRLEDVARCVPLCDLPFDSVDDCMTTPLRPPEGATDER